MDKDRLAELAAARAEGVENAARYKQEIAKLAEELAAARAKLAAQAEAETA